MIKIRRCAASFGIIMVMTVATGLTPSGRADENAPNASTKSQQDRLQRIFAAFSEGHNGTAERETWREMADNCGHGHGKVGAQLSRSDSSLPKPRFGLSFLNPPFSNLPISSIRFYCQTEGKLWASPWYNNNAFGGEFSLRQDDRGIVLFDWKLSGAIARIDFRSPVNYEASETAVNENQKSIVSRQTIDDALRHWIDQAGTENGTPKTDETPKPSEAPRPADKPAP